MGGAIPAGPHGRGAPCQLLSCLVASALAQEWPQPGKTVQLIVPALGGSGTDDTIARVVAEELQSRMKTTFVVDNKAGANGNIGASAAAATAGDGSYGLESHTVSVHLREASGQRVRWPTSCCTRRDR